MDDAIRTVLITGCSSGIGLDVALAFARRGNRTIATMRNLAKAEALRSSAAKEGLELDIVQLDVTDDESVKQAIRDVTRRHGPIDVLVNNAGVGHGGAVETIDLERAREVFETNVWGPVRMIRAVLPAMRERRSGVIINVTSVAGRVPTGGFVGFYGSSKHAICGLSEALSAEVAPFGVRVVSIEPGFFATNIMDNAKGDASIAGPYAAQHAWVDSFYQKSVAAAPSALDIVSNAIIAAAEDANTPLHVLVGDDAKQFVELIKNIDSYEAWTQIAQQIVEGVAGPRPQ